MHVSVKWFDGKYPSFNLNLHSKEGEPEFLSIKGCRIVQGQNGDFVSFPSTKNDSGKYWNHAWANEKFANHVLEIANAARPSASQPKQKKEDLDGDSIPF